MKTNCIGVAELLCAYADGELEKSKIHIVEDHLLICENCSAILKLYGEISAAIDDTNVPAPEILRPGVMNRIQVEEIYTDTEKVKKRKQYHFVLTRFAPVAACLLVGLLIWQPWSNTFNMGRDMAMPANQMEMDDGSFYNYIVEPTPEVLADTASPGAPETTADSDAAGEPVGESNTHGENFDSDGMLRMFLSQDDELLLEHINSAYAEITIKGELPGLLQRYIQHAVGPWFEWDMIFEIPSTELSALLDELGNNEDSAITRNEQNARSSYVMVFFSYEDQQDNAP